MQMPDSITVRVHREDGQLWAQVEEFPGCFASGMTPAELEQSLVEGLSLYLSEPGRPVRVDLSPQEDEQPAEFVEQRTMRLCPA